MVFNQETTCSHHVVLVMMTYKHTSDCSTPVRPYLHLPALPTLSPSREIEQAAPLNMGAHLKGRINRLDFRLCIFPCTIDI